MSKPKPLEHTPENFPNTPIIEPQPGPQTEFLGCHADIVIYGGAAGGGKSFGLLIDPLRNVRNPHFGGVIFRRTAVQVRNEGGLWDESMKLYPQLRGRPREHSLSWVFPDGAAMSFANLEHEKDLLNYQGSQMPWIGFDELTHFTEQQFFYMLSRNRSTSGVKPRIRATCNPDPDSFVRKLIDWWIGKDGFPIKERAGKLRYFIRISDEMIWADDPEEIYAKYGRGPDIIPTSITFIPSKLDDNQILMRKDPTYAARLLALSRVDRMRLREGNWNVRASAGMMFKREWFTVLDAIPSAWMQQCRYWDRAATKPSETNKDPDWTRGLKMYKYPNGTFLVADLKSTRDTPGQVEKLVTATASHDAYDCTVYGEQDPGSAGVADAERFTKILAGYDVRMTKPTKDKVTRAKPVSAQAEAGNIFVLRAPWNDEFFQELENFPEGAHDDIVDTLSGAFNELQGGASILDVL
jgi:predicted phage terminase large subunit-like protein